ncbi:MAG: hypothetical protein R8G66_25935 [Cytophagales bacterium]|nr:hypothetical protein [Cytophagales bacterium]
MKRRPLYASILVGLVFSMIIGCTGNDQKRNGRLSDAFGKLEELDLFFESTIKLSSERKLLEASNHIDQAISYIYGLKVPGDTIHKELIEYLTEDLRDLSDGLISGGVISENSLRRTFESISRSLASYHLSIAEAYYLEGGENREGLDHLMLALTRANKSAFYHGYTIPEEDLQETRELFKVLRKSDKSSPQVWKRTNAIIKKLNKSLKAHRKKNTEAYLLPVPGVDE